MKFFCGYVLAFLISATGICFADSYPSRPIRVIVSHSAGSLLDGHARAMALKLQANMGQSVVIENAPGASSNLGMAKCASSPADDHTICITTNSTVGFNPFLFARSPLGYDRDLVAMQRLVWLDDGVIAASHASGFKSVKEVVEAAKAKPGKILFKCSA